jgi:enoyl-CoA hydratase
VTGICLAVESRGEAGRVATITVDNPAKLNVLDPAGIASLERILEGLAADETLRVLVLQGAGGRAFIGGADIRAMAALDRERTRSFINGLHRACAAIRRLSVPVIARIEGYALGAGLEVAASCDLRVASDTAKFGMPEVKIGIPSVIEAALLPRLVGWGRARRLIYTGEIIDAREAERWGLVERVVASADLVRPWRNG